MFQSAKIITMASCLAIFFMALLAFAKIGECGYDYNPDDDVRGNYFQDHFMARAFGFKRSLKQKDTSSSPKIFRVDDFGAKGNGTDATQAFERAWDEACSSQGSVSLVVPGDTYLLKPMTFKGPCKSDRVRVQIHGTVRAYGDMSGYVDDNQRRWIVFDGVHHLTVEGGGTINGWGRAWWNRSCKVHRTRPCPRAPTAMTFHKCEDLVVRNVRSLNPQGVHVSIHSCNNVTVSGVTVTAPGNSPNTDGINVRETTNLVISDSVIRTGDDCIALNHGTRHVKISGITCGPGHGISIGSLGKENSEEHVSDVVVDGATLSGTTNGLRIKTWQGGSGSASGIKFMNIRMENVQNPIFIDQFYFCERHDCQTQKSAVQVEDVLYQNITGTTASPIAVLFDCSDASKCRRIVLQDIDLRLHHGNNATASCTNIQLTQIGHNIAPLCPNNPSLTRSTTTASNTSPSAAPRPDPPAESRPDSPSAPRPDPPVVPRRNPSPSAPRRNVLSVEDFGAKGDGNSDDTEAFNKAWKQACSSNNQETTLLVPQNNYLLKPVRFGGPCNSKITIQILGNIEASKRRLDYPDRHWIWFDKVNDLVVKGGGTIDGNGEVWWRDTCKWNKSRPCTEAPTALSFQGCKGLEVKDLTIKNSQQIQVLFVKCVDVKAHNLTVTAPGNSPNTDGVHITHSQNVDIFNSNIATGDDCISIVSGSRNISASDIRCGPGHGISIGSLGGGNAEAHVLDVTVTRARFFGSTNGVRIKTWQGGSGNVTNVRFTDLEMHNVRNPIIIDQNYCIEKACHQEKSAVQVKNVVYQNIRGTVDRDAAIILDCSERHKCEGIVLQDIDLRTPKNGDHTQAVCNNVDFADIRNVSPACPN